MGWTRIYVEAERSDHNIPLRMLGLVMALEACGATFTFRRGAGLPAQQPDGTFEVHVMNAAHMQAVRTVLEREGVIIHKGEEHAEPYPEKLFEQQP
jgi:hypothetical protein